jgi:predicted DNA-binding transcriptional regulator AlpA
VTAAVTPSPDLSRSAGRARGSELAKPVPVVVPERHLYRIPEAMLLLSMKRTQIYELIRSGRLKTVTEGRSRFVPAKAISEYLDLLLKEAGVSYDQAS